MLLSFILTIFPYRFFIFIHMDSPQIIFKVYFFFFWAGFFTTFINLSETSGLNNRSNWTVISTMNFHHIWPFHKLWGLCLNSIPSLWDQISLLRSGPLYWFAKTNINTLQKLNKHKYLMLKFGGLQVQGQSIGGVGFSWVLSPRLIDGQFLPVFIFFCVCVLISPP